MKVILLKDVQKLGKKYEIKDVSSGHAINLLIPNGFAMEATKQALKRVESEKSKIETERKIQDDLMLGNLRSLDGVVLNISGKANEKGHLFAGLHSEEIAKELEKQTRLTVDPSFIQLEHPIKEIGEHDIEVKIEGKSAKFKLVISEKK